MVFKLEILKTPKQLTLNHCFHRNYVINYFINFVIIFKVAYITLYTSIFLFLFYFHHTTCESTCDTLNSLAANQGDNTVSVAQGGTAIPGATKQLLPRHIILLKNYIQKTAE